MALGAPLTSDTWYYYIVFFHKSYTHFLHYTVPMLPLIDILSVTLPTSHHKSNMFTFIIIYPQP